MTARDDNDLLRLRLLGRSLACESIGDLDRDLVLAENSPGKLDLAMVEGADNLGQSLAIAVTTPLGGDVFNTEFGFDGLNALSDATTPLLIRERIRVGLVMLLRKDPRVARIVDIKLADRRLDSPEASAARRLDVRVVFETVTGETLALGAGPSGARMIDG